MVPQPTAVQEADRVAALTSAASDTPEIVIDLDVVRANIVRTAAMARNAGVALRPHTKTHKLPQIAQLQLDANAVGVQVAKLGEAEVMADGGIERHPRRLPDRRRGEAAAAVRPRGESLDHRNRRLRRGRARARRRRRASAGSVARATRARHRHAPPRCYPGPGRRRARRADRIARRARARRRLHPRGARLHAGSRPGGEGAADARGVRGGSRDGRGDPRARAAGARGLGRVGGNVPLRDPHAPA